MSTSIDNSFLTHASEILGDTESGLTGTQIVKHCNSYAVEFSVAIPVSSTDFGKFGSNIPNKRTALLKNLQAFSAAQQFRIIKELCELPQFSNNSSASQLKAQLYERYGTLNTEKISKTELVQKTKHWLSAHPQALEQYENALVKYESGKFERNTLDDMRLSFELLVKDLMGNQKSLENQLGDIGSMLKSAGASAELRNMVPAVIKYYTDFQNNHVKHKEAINSNEIEYVIELTSVIMKFLIKANEGEQ